MYVLKGFKVQNSLSFAQRAAEYSFCHAETSASISDLKSLCMEFCYKENHKGGMLRGEGAGTHSDSPL
jgi:hypothetical protein